MLLQSAAKCTCSIRSRPCAAAAVAKATRPSSGDGGASQHEQAAPETHQLLVGHKEVPSKGKVRLDAYLSTRLPSTSRARLQASIKAGGVLVNGRQQAKASSPVRPGDRIACTLQPLPPLQAQPEPIPLDVVFEDQYLMVINKPAGMVVHPSPGHSGGTLVNALLHHCGLPPLNVVLGNPSSNPSTPGGAPSSHDGKRAALAALAALDVGRASTAGAGVEHGGVTSAGEVGHEGGSGRDSGGENGGDDEGEDEGEDEDEDQPGVCLLPAPVSVSGGAVVIRPGVVHRLDKGTSGLLVVAKRERAHQHLCDQFKARTVDRIYLSVTLGTPSPASGSVHTNIGRCSTDRKRMAAYAYGSSRGREARSRYRVLARLLGGRAALVEWRLQTGRTHQIRVHAKHIGHPLLCDETYGAAPGTSAAALAHKQPSQ